MVVIRLARAGSKKNPFYHVVVADKRNSRDGRFIEQVGHFNPMARGKETRLTLNNERITDWVGKGAQPSDRVAYLIKEFTRNEGQVPAAPTKAEQRKAQAEASHKAHKAAAKADKEGADAAKEEDA